VLFLLGKTIFEHSIFNTMSIRNFRLAFTLVALFAILWSCTKEYSAEGITVNAAVGSLTKTVSGDCSPATINATLIKNSPAGDSNRVTLSVNITTPGTYTIKTDTVNGISYAASGVFGTTGLQNVTLRAVGTPINAGTFLHVVRFDTSFCSFPVTVANAVGNDLFTLNGSPSACSMAVVNGTYTVGTVTTSANTVVLQVTAIQTGTWSMSTGPISGLTFAGSGTITATGPQTITLTATGTPTAAGATTFPVTTNTSNCSFTVNIADLNYLPLTNGTWRSYDNTLPTFMFDSLKKVISGTAVKQGNTYAAMLEQNNTTTFDTTFLRKSGSNYHEYMPVTKYAGITFSTMQYADIIFLKEGAAVGHTWDYEFMGTYNSFATKIRYIYSIEDNNATQVVNGRTFTKCIQVRLKVQLQIGTLPYADAATFDTYFANNIGLVRLNAALANAVNYQWLLKNFVIN
jgi:hypothetical protein